MSARGSNFSGWQEGSQSVRETLIQEYLDVLRGTRVRFEYVTDLAELVARHLSQVQDAPCSTSTLLRNVRYKAKLLTYYTQTKGAAKASAPTGSSTEPITSKLELGNLKQEVQRLTIYVSTLENELSATSAGRALLSSGSGKEQRISDPHEPWLAQVQLHFVRTCQVLTTLLDYLKVTLEVDVETKQIRDRSKLRNNVIVGADIASPFVDWLVLQSKPGGSAT